MCRDSLRAGGGILRAWRGGGNVIVRGREQCACSEGAKPEKW
jgi:hypothetical protein